MNNVIHAIRTENQASAVTLQQLEACVEAKKDYLSKVKINFLYSWIYQVFYDRKKNVNHVNCGLRL
jgi:hypothetical protein